MGKVFEFSVNERLKHSFRVKIEVIGGYYFHFYPLVFKTRRRGAVSVDVSEKYPQNGKTAVQPRCTQNPRKPAENAGKHISCSRALHVFSFPYQASISAVRTHGRQFSRSPCRISSLAASARRTTRGRSRLFYPRRDTRCCA